MVETLTIFGLCWLIVGNVLGLVLTKEQEPLTENLDGLTSHDELLEYYQMDWAYRWSKTCHAHSALFSIFCILIGLVLRAYEVPPSIMTTTICYLFMISVPLWTIAGFRKIKPLMGISDFMFIGGVALTAYTLYGVSFG